MKSAVSTLGLIMEVKDAELSWPLYSIKELFIATQHNS